MAQIDIKNATVRVLDGTRGTAVLNSGASDADLTFTAVSTHVGSDQIRVRLVNPGTPSASLSVVVSENDITVNLATSTASAITSTAADVRTAILASPAAAALVTVALETVGAGVVDAFGYTALAGQNWVEVKIGDGNLTYSESRPVEFTLNRGVLDTVKLADEEPLSVSMDATWEYLTASTGGTPTVEDVMKRRGEAAAWVSTSDDPCQPYCVDIEIHNAPGCVGNDDEIITIEEFYFETVDHDLREGTLNFSGRANRKFATVRRVAPAA